MEYIKVLDGTISILDLQNLEALWKWEYVKGVVDLEKRKVAVGGQWHKEAAQKLIDEGSDPKNIWGFRLYPLYKGERAIDYESNLNISEARGNPGRAILSEELQSTIRSIVSPLAPDLLISE